MKKINIFKLAKEKELEKNKLAKEKKLKRKKINPFVCFYIIYDKDKIIKVKL